MHNDTYFFAAVCCVLCIPLHLDLQLLQQSGSMVGRSQSGTSKSASSTGAVKGRKGSAKNKSRGSAASYLDDVAAPYLPLPAGQINIKRLVNANIAEPSKQKITGGLVVYIRVCSWNLYCSCALRQIDSKVTLSRTRNDSTILLSFNPIVYFIFFFIVEYTAVNFHPNGDLLLVAGEDKYMRFFRIDGDKNEKQLAVRVNDMIIQNATFRSNSGGGGGGSSSGGEVDSNSSSRSAEEVVLCGRKPFFYSYDTESGNIAKIPGKNAQLVPMTSVAGTKGFLSNRFLG